MKLRNKKTGDVREFDGLGGFTLSDDYPNLYTEDKTYNSLAELNEEWEDCKGPLIENEKVRKVVRAWADINSLEHFTVVNEHFNCCKIMGRKNNRVSKIEFLTTIPNTTHRTYTIAELCGEGEE